MPIYTLNCSDCDRKVDVLVRSRSRICEAMCPACNGSNLHQIIARVARVRSAGERLDNIDVDAELGQLEGKDPAAFSRWARKMGTQFDSELGSDFQELADRADAGDDPIERFDAEHTLRYRIDQARNQSTDNSDDFLI